MRKTPMPILLRIIVLLAVLGTGGLPVWAQWTTQTIQLRPGWNAVFLEIQPEPRECDTIFGGLPIESVWAWNRRFNSVQFIQDPTTLVPGQPDWLTYLPPTHPARAGGNLFILEGGHAYLINLAANANPVTWTIKGKPVVRGIDWLSDSLNLVGFHVTGANPPTFQSFFASSPAHAGQPIYRLSVSGLWEKIANPSTATLKNGEAYWVRTQGQSTYSGPLTISLEQRTGLNYGRTLTEQRLRIKNSSATVKTLDLIKLASASPPNSSYPALAGEVPLSYFKMNLENNEYGWLPLPAALEKLDVLPGEEWVLRLEVRRADMASFTGAAGALYQSLLEVSDEEGSRYLVPVSAQGLQVQTGSGVGVASLSSVSAPHPRSGLWVGSAVIKKISQPASVGQPNTPAPTASEFQFRLIVHVDRQGQARLLQKVLQMWKNGTTKPDPDDPPRQIVDIPGRFVLLTDDSLIPNFSGATLRDGQLVGRRMSSTAFSFKSPIAMTGPGDFGANLISGVVALDYDDPQNPFKHQYHPDHDNLDERFEQKLREGIESFTVTRKIDFEFQAKDPDGLALAGWGDNQLGGIYRETITGLHQKTLYLEGTFRVHHASRVAVLNDQN